MASLMVKSILLCQQAWQRLRSLTVLWIHYPCLVKITYLDRIKSSSYGWLATLPSLHHHQSPPRGDDGLSNANLSLQTPICYPSIPHTLTDSLLKLCCVPRDWHVNANPCRFIGHWEGEKKKERKKACCASRCCTSNGHHIWRLVVSEIPIFFFSIGSYAGVWSAGAPTWNTCSMYA